MIMFETIDALREQAAKRREADEAAYVALVTKMATGKLTKAEESRLNALINCLSYSLERVEADGAICREAATLAAACASLETLKARQRGMGNQLALIAKESDAAISAIQQRLAEFRQEVRQAETEANAARDASERLTELRNAHWRLLGAEDPAIVSRRRHLCQVVLGRPTGATADVIEFESVMRFPGLMSVQNFDATDFVPAPGQTLAELDALKARARTLITSGKEARYLCVCADESRMSRKDSHYAIDEIAIDEISAHAYAHLPLPGVSPEEFEGLQKKLAARLKATRKRQQIRDGGGDPGQVGTFDPRQEIYINQ